MPLRFDLINNLEAPHRKALIILLKKHQPKNAKRNPHQPIKSNIIFSYRPTLIAAQVTI